MREFNVWVKSLEAEAFLSPDKLKSRDPDDGKPDLQGSNYYDSPQAINSTTRDICSLWEE